MFLHKSRVSLQNSFWHLKVIQNRSTTTQKPTDNTTHKTSKSNTHVHRSWIQNDRHNESQKTLKIDLGGHVGPHWAHRGPQGGNAPPEATIFITAEPISDDCSNHKSATLNHCRRICPESSLQTDSLSKHSRKPCDTIVITFRKLF